MWCTYVFEVTQLGTNRCWYGATWTPRGSIWTPLLVRQLTNHKIPLWVFWCVVVFLGHYLALWTMTHCKFIYMFRYKTDVLIIIPAYRRKYLCVCALLFIITNSSNKWSTFLWSEDNLKSPVTKKIAIKISMFVLRFVKMSDG